MMDRQALLLYLQNVQDLEAVRWKIGGAIQALKPHYEPQIEAISTEPAYVPIPKYERTVSKLHRSSCIALGVAVAAVALAAALYFLLGKPLFLLVFLAVSPVLLVPLVVLVVLQWPESERAFYDRVGDKIDAAEEENAKQQIAALQNATLQEQLRMEWRQKERKLREADAQAAELLQAFYGMDILPVQYRNLLAVACIYRAVSTAQATLEDALLLACMEQGTDRMTPQLDQLADAAYDARRVWEWNRSTVERMTAQSLEMLRQLQSTADSAEAAAQYAELAANYEKANAYFATLSLS